jgi:diaminohydroxyphosphoribosylaminopyrimidine deaminase/5-amino-6-(5-phosphoribosylamino)uracil reductase
VHLKLASSLDGRIATAGGDSRWISTDRSRALVQQMRRRAEAILVGVGTVLADDPRLTCRIPGARPPLRVVLDPELRTPADAKVVRGRGHSLIIGSLGNPGNAGTPGSKAAKGRSGNSRGPKMSAAQARRRDLLSGSGALVECFDTRGVRGWKRLLGRLAGLGVMELLIEGGGQVAASAIRAGVVNRVSIFYNPRFLGADGVAMIGPLGVRRASDGPKLHTLGVSRVGEDHLWEGEFQ